MTEPSEVRWRILLVEDNEEVGRTTKATLERRPLGQRREMASVHLTTRFDEALAELDKRLYDLVILDIRDQTEVGGTRDFSGAAGVDDGDSIEADRGLGVFEKIRERRFVPVLFYSAVAHLAQDLSQPPFVTVVGKLDDDPDSLRSGVSAVFDSGLPSLSRSIGRHVESVVRDFMSDFVMPFWSELNSDENAGDLAYLLIRKLSRSLDNSFIFELIGAGDTGIADERVHPTRMYVVPPVGDWNTGDVFRSRDSPYQYQVVLTPACDLVLRSDRTRKADYVVLADCDLLSGTDEYKAWKQTDSRASRVKLDKLLSNNRDGQQDRNFFLPSAWGVPGLVVDLQRISHLDISELENFDRVLTLDDPYVQSLVARFARYLGRMGTPDLDVDSVRQRLPSGSESSVENE